MTSFIDIGDRIHIPKGLLDAWKIKYGPEDYNRTITEIITVVKTFNSLNTPQPLSQSAILREVCNRISNKEFAITDLGKFVFIAILTGREVDPGKFFRGSNASPRAGSSVLITEVLPQTEDRNGHLRISLTVSFEGFHFKVTKSIVDVFRLLY